MIESDRLNIMPLKISDCEDVHYKNSHPEVAEFNTIGIPKNIEATQRLLQPLFKPQNPDKEQVLGWSIRLKTDNTFIGELGMRVSSPKYNKAEIHYSLTPKYWNKGYANEAVKALIQYGLEVLNLHRIEAGVAIKNERSIKLLEKVGMVREGHHKKILPINGKWMDNYSYAIVKDNNRS